MDSAPARRANRRLTARVACHLTVSYRTAKDWHPATAMDLSRRGCRLRLGESLARAAAVTVRLEAPAGQGRPGPTVDVPGAVIWSRPEGLSHQAGILFKTEPVGLDELLSSLD